MCVHSTCRKKYPLLWSSHDTFLSVGQIQIWNRSFSTRVHPVLLNYKYNSIHDDVLQQKYQASPAFICHIWNPFTSQSCVLAFMPLPLPINEFWIIHSPPWLGTSYVPVYMALITHGLHKSLSNSDMFNDKTITEGDKEKMRKEADTVLLFALNE